MVNTHYLTNKVGARPGSATTDAEFELGEIGIGNGGSEWVYVQANGAITQYDWVGVDENHQAAALLNTMVGDGWTIGVAQVAFTDNQYGWVATKAHGAVNGRLAASCAADSALWTTATAGVLDDATAAGMEKVRGVVAVTAAATNATNRECIVNVGARSNTL